MIAVIDPRSCTERQLMEKVVELARSMGWITVHFGGNLHKRAWYDAAGFPDLLLINPSTGVIMFCELKSAVGKMSDAQLRWQRLLTSENLNHHVWRPADWPDIVQLLTAGRGRVA